MGIREYFRRSSAELRGRKWLAVAAAFFLFLGGTNAALALSHPPVDDSARALFAGAAILRVVALVWIGVVALRRAAASPRRSWIPDGALWLYFLLTLIGFVGPILAGFLGLGLQPFLREGIMQLAGVLVILPFAPWLVAAAVERPLAWSPAPWLVRFREWLPPLALLSLLTVFPLAWLHAWLSGWLIAMKGHAGFVELVLADAVVTTAFVIWSLALQLTAYRRVAQG
ncbi:MAG TPA: hypothetical protein VEA60_05365 [Allosphingosinicella sp.]|nr:hypothetical protein [Allosphingosinicella sp.]